MPLRRLITLIITAHSRSSEENRQWFFDNEKTNNHSIYPTENFSCIKFCGSKFPAGLSCAREHSCNRRNRSFLADNLLTGRPLGPIGRLRWHRANPFFTM